MHDLTMCSLQMGKIIMVKLANSIWKLVKQLCVQSTYCVQATYCYDEMVYFCILPLSVNEKLFIDFRLLGKNKRRLRMNKCDSLINHEICS